MRASIVLSSLFAAVALGGCATSGGVDAPARVASANECKAVTVYTASESIRNSVRGTQASDMQRTEGAMAINRVAGSPPASLRTPGGLDSLPAEVSRGC
jgi:hypothetical protein